MDKSNYAVIGGDLRSVKLAEQIMADGLEVSIYGFDNAGFEIGTEVKKNVCEAVTGANYIIGPIPCSNDNETVNAPFNSTTLYIEQLFKAMTADQMFIAGRIGPQIKEMAKSYNIRVVDLLEREEMAVLNVIPTAEGAIQIAMEEMPITLHSCKALVLGYGRIGKILAKMLNGIGADVHVEARKHSDIAWIRGYSYKPVPIDELQNYLGKMDVIFNTVPHMILDNDLLSLINPDTLIIDLASKPGGVDILFG
jgi:Lactate dehydrogenase and related dehydrogenases